MELEFVLCIQPQVLMRPSEYIELWGIEPTVGDSGRVPDYE